VKIATWNVNGIRAREAQFREWVEVERPDVVCLQEIKAASAQVPAALCEMEGFWCYWHGAGGYSGVGLHVSKEFAPERPAFTHPEFDHETRIVMTRIPLPAKANTGIPAVTVASIYVPNGGKDFPAKMRFLGALERYAAGAAAAGDPIVLCGDLNVARAEIDVHPKERKPTIIGQLPEERELFEKILSHGLVDVGRAADPQNEGLFTWWAPWRNMRQRNIGWRLDYVLASDALARQARECAVRKDIGTSDHAPVVAVFGKAESG
jgi:exodeoxyribonuclease-3